MHVDINKAKQLRTEGKQYKEIAETLGCSVSWCKVYLREVKTPKQLVCKCCGQSL
jgi:predicted transcriptional regulator